MSPDSFTSFAGQPNAFPDTWPRHWGAQLWAINFLYLPVTGIRQHRWPNWMGIAIRLTFAAFFFSQGDGFVPGNLGRRVGPSAALHIFAGCAKRSACFALKSERDVSNTGCRSRSDRKPQSSSALGQLLRIILLQARTCDARPAPACDTV